MIPILEMTDKDRDYILETLKDADFSEDEAIEIINILEEYEDDDTERIAM